MPTRLLLADDHQMVREGIKWLIVALTAHALKGDREQCLTAGMDGYLTKPLRADELASELHRIMATVPTEPPAPPADPPVEMATAMRYVGGDHALLAELTALFLDDAGERLQTIRTATRPVDAEAAERAAHSLKSTLAIFGAHRSAALAGEIEVLSHDGRLEESAGLLDTLEHEVGLVTAFLRAAPLATRTEGGTTR
jgi:HPt (histidine-containing phosphotransfer) domain-containing protein